MIKHIGLQIIECDIKNFYEKVLDFKLLRSFVLTQENATNIFGISHETKVLVGSCPEMELELFIHKKASVPTFNHVCFQTHRMVEIISNAKLNGYKTFILSGSETLFLSDSNQNIFEIKKSI